MLLDISVTIQNQTISYNSEGMAEINWSASETTEKSNKQPLSGELAFNEYGISEAGISDLFFLQTSTDALEGGRIVYNSTSYDIYRIEKYQNHYEAIVKKVVS